MTRSEELAAQMLKRLRKREHKTLTQIADELGVGMKSLCRSAPLLLRDGTAVKHEDKRPATYTKA